MKLTAFSLFIFSLHVCATGFSQSVTYTGKNVPLEKVFNAVEQQTGFVFFYDYRQVSGAKVVDLDAKNQPLIAFLENCLRDQPFGFAIEEKTIIITRKATPPATAATTVIAADTGRPVTGYVYGEDNTPLPGATVVVRGTKLGAATDVHGAFQFRNVPPGAVLEITFIGYNKLVKALPEHQPTMILVMTPATNTLDEKVVQAYGVTSQRYATGNISTVSAKEIEKQPVMNPLMALQGQVPGLVLTPNSSAYPSAAVKVELRGRNTLDPNLPSDPLYVIDGVPLTILNVAPPNTYNTTYSNGSSGFIQNSTVGLYNGTNAAGQSPFMNMNPGDIESISVLKDADATAIYGARAANGVILITTKHGNAGKTTLNVTANQGTSFITKRWDLLNTPQYLQMRREAFANAGITPTPANAPDLLTWDTTRFTDWQKYMWGNMGEVTDAQLGLNGGDSRTLFRLSAGYHQQRDISTFSGNNQRMNMAYSLSHSSLDRKLNINFQGTYAFTNITAENLPNTVTLPPDAPPVYDAKGNLNYAGWGTTINYPFQPLKMPYSSKTYFLNTNLSASYNIYKGLSALVSLGYNTANNAQLTKSPIAGQNPLYNPTGTVSMGRSDNNNWQVEPQLRYIAAIGKGTLDALLGSSLNTTTSEGLNTSGSGILSDAQLGSISNASSFRSSDNWGRQKVASVFARFSYNWDNKYILSLNARRDGSTNFAPANRWGSFGAVGASWIITEEKWMKNILPGVLSYAKLRGSYGTTGGSGATPYSYLTQWSSDFTNLPYGGVQTSNPRIHADPDYHWEVDKKLDVSLSLGFLRDRINLMVDYYRNRCDNQLISQPLAYLTGFNSVVGNLDANVQNSGLEISSSARIVSTRKFTWTAAFNMAINRNKLLSFPNLLHSSYYRTYKVGEPTNFILAYHSLGVDPQTGSFRIEDHDKDGSIQQGYSLPAGQGDQYVFIKTDPKFTGGMQQSLTYSGITLSASFYFKKQRSRLPIPNGAGSLANISTYMYDNSWHKPGDKALFAKLNSQYDPGYGLFYSSDGVWGDGSFIRLGQLSLSYAIPSERLKKTWMRSLSVNILTNNIFTITRYKGADPETASFGSMPPARIITGGLSCSF